MKLFKTVKFAVLLSILTLAPVVPAQVSDRQRAEIDGLFKEWDTKTTPGAAVGVVKDGKLIFSKGYGMADLEHDVPLTPSSVFYMASVSKQFVTFAVLLLEEEGKIGLDDEIQKYLPDFPRYKDPLTIRHFIHHTSGVRDSLTLWSLTGRDIMDHVPKDEMYELLKRQKELNFKPGDQYLYSNACYFMLALVIEKVSGKSIRDFAEERMFKPLGMKNTHFHDDQFHIVKNRVFSYSPSKDGYRNLIMRFDLVGSGGLYSSIEDMLLWDQNFYNNKLGKGRQELIKLMESDGRLNNGKSAGYAFGISNGTHKGLRTVEHGGALAGYRTFSLRYPDENFSVYVLANVSNFNAGGISRAVAEIFLRDRFKEAPVVETAENKASDEREVKLSDAEQKAVAGNYFRKETGMTIRVLNEDGALRFQERDDTPIPLKPLGKTRFRVADPNQDIVLNFELDGAKASKMDVVFDGSSSFGFVAFEPANYTTADLQEFAGSYFSDEINTFYHLKMENDALTLYINDKRIGALKVLTRSVFIYNEVGSFEFDIDESGSIRGFSLDAGRVRNLKFRRK